MRQPKFEVIDRQVLTSFGAEPKLRSLTWLAEHYDIAEQQRLHTHHMQRYKQGGLKQILLT
jgi:hypothetical protein